MSSKGVFYNSLHNVIYLKDGADLHERSKKEHVGNLRGVDLGSLLDGLDGVDGDVSAGGLAGDGTGGVDEYATGFYHRLELVHGLLVQYDSGAELLKDR